MNIRKVDHLVLTTANSKDILAFYQTIGFKIHDKGYRYEACLDDFKINIHEAGRELQPNAFHAQPGTLDVCFEIEGDIASWRKQLVQKGYQPTEILMKDGAKGNMYSFYVCDPDLNLIEFCSYDNGL